jgi:UPF0755 protein
VTERSAEEREAARREREQRRTGAPSTVTTQSPVAPRPTVLPSEDLPDPPERTAPPPAPRRRRRHRWPGRLLAVAAILVVVLVLWFLESLFEPFAGSAHGSVTVTIPAHSSTGQIADILERDGVIGCSFPDCSLLFKIRTALASDGGKLLPGTYHLKLDMTFSSVLSALTTPPPAAPVSEVTITPGKTRAALDQILRRERIKGSYLAETRHSSLLNPVSYGAPRSTPSLEGFLFPDTFQLRKPISIPALVADQLRDFKRHFGSLDLSYARSHHLTPYDVLTIASLVEGEAATAHDRPLVASVIYNRLRLHMPLQIDATVRYAVGNYKTPITPSQLHSHSPWNTYTHTGLPPTPIDSPGLASMQAAAHPARTNYLYFVVKPCGNGEEVFASSYAQFLRYEQQYNTARAQNGGRSPAHCSH